MRNETSQRKTVRDVFVSEYGSGFNVFNTPLDHEDKTFLVGLLADTDPEELTKTSIENRYSLRVHFMEKADSLVTYCDSRRFVVFVVWFDEFVVSEEVNEQCLACDTVGGYKLDGTEGQTHSEDNYRREVVFCESCLGSLSNRLKDGEFTASVVSNHI